MASAIHTIGHSTHSIEKLISLLKLHAINAIADIRSSPYSRNPQFNRTSLHESLNDHNIMYVFLGEELGARPKDQSCYENGRVRYDRLTRTESFRRGIERVKKGSESYHIALLCAEKDPIFCHRMILLSSPLAKEGFNIHHILESGEVESQRQAEERLLRKLRILDSDMFRPKADIVAEAFRRQAYAIAYQEQRPSEPKLKLK
jgi:uncharacterized protein (DUF488 family)